MTDIWVDVVHGRAGHGNHVLSLSPREVAVLSALLESRGRVLPRRELARRAGLADASPRRCDSLLVGLRRALGEGAVRNVRGRGWMISPPPPR